METKIDLLEQLNNKSVKEIEWLLTVSVIKQLSLPLQKLVYNLAIPHSFNLDLLIYILEDPNRAKEYLDLLIKLPFVKKYGKSRHHIRSDIRKLVIKNYFIKEHYNVLVEVAKKIKVFLVKLPDFDEDNKAVRIEIMYLQALINPKQADELVTDTAYQIGQENDSAAFKDVLLKMDELSSYGIISKNNKQRYDKVDNELFFAEKKDNTLRRFNGHSKNHRKDIPFRIYPKNNKEKVEELESIFLEYTDNLKHRKAISIDYYLSKIDDLRIQEEQAVYYKAQLHIIDGQLSKAEHLIQKLFEINPNYIEYYRLRGIYHRERFELKEAVADFETVLSINKNDKEAKAREGEARQEQGRLEMAQEMLINSYEEDIPWVQAQIGETYLIQGSYLKAFEQLDSAITANGQLVWAYVDRGIANRYLNRIPQAFKDFNTAIQLDPHYAWAYLQKALTHREKGEYGDAINDLTTVIEEIAPTYELAYAERGLTYRYMMKYENAIKDFNTALTIDPQSSDNYSFWLKAQLGTTYRFSEDFKSAIALLTESITLKPDFFWAFAQRGIAFTEIGDYDNALKDFTVVIESKDSDDIENKQWVLNRRGELWIELNRPQKAFEDFDAATKLDPIDKFAYYNKGVALLELAGKELDSDKQLEKYTAALNYFHRALDIDDRFIRAKLFAAYTYHSLDNYSIAERFYNQAIRDDSKDPNSYNMRGVLYYDMDRHYEAIQDFTTAIYYDKENALDEVYFNRGCVYRSLNQSDLAIEDFLTAIYIDNEDLNNYLEYAITLKFVGKNVEAEYYFSKVVTEASPEDFNNYHIALAHKAELDWVVENYDEALEGIEEAISSRDGFYTWAYRQKAIIHLLRDELMDSINSFEEVLKEKPKDIFSRFYLSLVYFSKGEYNRASMELKASLNLAQDNKLEDYNELIEEDDENISLDIFIALAKLTLHLLEEESAYSIIDELKNKLQLKQRNLYAHLQQARLINIIFRENEEKTSGEALSILIAFQSN